MKKLFFAIGLIITLSSLSSKIMAQDFWADFKFPVITYIDEDKISEGAKLFNRLVPNPDSVLKAQIIVVCKIIYQKPSEVPNKTEFKFQLRNTSGVAATGGGFSESIDMFLSSKYVEDFYNNNGKSDQKMLDEITGILIHELTHAYQTKVDGYPYIIDIFGFVEGMADGVRIKSGYMPSSRRIGGHWNDGYRVTGYFLDWLYTKDPDFLYKFNQSGITINPWNWDKFTQQVFGKPVMELWSEYQRHLNPSGSIPQAKLVTDTTTTVTNGTILFKDLSSGGPFLWNWKFEGGEPSGSNTKSSYVTYTKAGVYKVSLAVQNAYGKDSITKVNYITVKENPDGQLITSLEGTKSTQHNDSPEDENVDKAFDNNSNTKFLSFHNSSWIQFENKKNQKFLIKKYFLISANDSPERDPKDFTLKGSNDGKTWEIIDSQTNVNFSSRYKALGFTPAATKKTYSKFRLEMNNHEGNILQVADFKLFGISKN